MQTSDVDQRERKTQARVVTLFRDRLGYDYLGNWVARPCRSSTFDRHGNQTIWRI